MPKVKLNERFNNAVEAFFDNEAISENQDIAQVEEKDTYQVEENFDKKPNNLFGIFKQALLFLPGALSLLYLSVALSGILFIKNGPTLNEANGLFFAIFILIPASFLMTLWGMGNVKKINHLLIPISVIGLGIVVGFVGSLLDLPYFGYFLDHYLPYFFPLALITPILVKSWVDKDEVSK